MLSVFYFLAVFSVLYEYMSVIYSHLLSMVYGFFLKLNVS